VRIRDGPAAVSGDESRMRPLFVHGGEGAASPVESCLRQDSFAVFNRASRTIRESEDLPEGYDTRSRGWSAWHDPLG